MAQDIRRCSPSDKAGMFNSQIHPSSVKIAHSSRTGCVSNGSETPQLMALRARGHHGHAGRLLRRQRLLRCRRRFFPCLCGLFDSALLRSVAVGAGTGKSQDESNRCRH